MELVKRYVFLIAYMYLIFDTETTGLPKKWNAPITDTDNWPRCVQLAWQLHDNNGKIISDSSCLIKANDFDIPFESEKIHGISTELSKQIGLELDDVLNSFLNDLNKTKYIIGHNLKFDLNIIRAELYRSNLEDTLKDKTVLDTCTEKTASLCKIAGGRSGKFKFPTLIELYQHLFSADFQNAHNASADVEATARSFFELVRIKNFNETDFIDFNKLHDSLNSTYSSKVDLYGVEHLNLKEESKKLKNSNNQEIEIKSESDVNSKKLESNFCHLHNNSQFSVLQSTSKISEIVKKSSDFGMRAVALTDKANMMGCFHFYRAVKNYNSDPKNTNRHIKPIIGCELNVCEDHKDKSSRDDGYQVVFLVKNKIGYQNLIKMCSVGYTDGFYYVPRVDKEVVLEYSEGLIVLSGNKYGEIPNKILNVGEKQAIEALRWWQDKFGEDFYLELNRHSEEQNEIVNAQLLKFSKEFNIKVVATNSTLYLDKEDANAHDILLCVKDGEKQSTPIGKGRNFRYGLENQEYYFKSPEQMVELFSDIPQSILNISEIVDKVEEFELQRDVLLPKFDIPEDFQTDSDDLENDYLKHLTLEGAKFHYKDLTNDLLERIDFELQVIKNSGYPGYFLIVQDLINAARKMGVSVGPGRGSVA